MTTEEFSNQFDVLYNNITSDHAPGLNEYEKSVFLTKAQNQLVNEYFNVRTDSIGGGFDGGQRRQYDFSSLIALADLEEVDSDESDYKKIDRRSRVFLFPSDYFLAVSEMLFDDRRQYAVLPINYMEYQRLMLKPYNFPVKKGAWRLLTEARENDNHKTVAVAEIIGKFDTSTLHYQLRYVKTLTPIVLDSLDNYGDGLTISGENNPTDCKLPVECHEEILERAVALAKIAWQGSTATQASNNRQQREQ